MQKLLLLTNFETQQKIIVGVDKIIGCKTIKLDGILTTQIKSTGAMVETFFVKESIEEIYKLYNSNTKNK